MRDDSPSLGAKQPSRPPPLHTSNAALFSFAEGLGQVMQPDIGKEVMSCMRNSRIATGALALAAMLLVAACSGQPLTEREKGTGVGALLGAGTGAIIGAAVGHPGAGAAIGGALGAGGGYVVGNEMQNQKVSNEQTQGQLQQQQQEIENQRREIEQMRQQQETE